MASRGNGSIFLFSNSCANFFAPEKTLPAWPFTLLVFTEHSMKKTPNPGGQVA